jgi:hypothetical protein
LRSLNDEQSSSRVTGYENIILVRAGTGYYDFSKLGVILVLIVQNGEARDVQPEGAKRLISDRPFGKIVAILLWRFNLDWHPCISHFTSAGEILDVLLRANTFQQ